LSRDYHKLNLNIGKEPFIFSTNTFKHNSEKDIIFHENKYFIPGSRSSLFILDANLNGIIEVFDYHSAKFKFVKKYKNYFITVSDDNIIKINEIKEETLEIKPLIKYNFGKIDICYVDIILEHIFIVVTVIKKIYKLNLNVSDKKINIYQNFSVLILFKIKLIFKYEKK